MEKEGNVLIRILLAVLLGFLPSFLIFSIFNQYGFSFSKYLYFLKDVSGSIVSWISIIVIFIIVYFFMKKIKSSTGRAIFLIIFGALIVGYILFYLYANFLLGNDILVKLSADKENLFFGESPEQSLTFTMSALINPFCIAQCKYSFIDISSGEEIDSGEFSMASVLPRTQDYSFNKEGHLLGQVIQRFELSCKSQKTKLCYTKEEESKRAVLITLNYDISQEQKIKNEISKKEILLLEETIYNLSMKIQDLNLTLKIMENFINTEEQSSSLTKLSNNLFDLNYSKEELKEFWASQDYSKFEKELSLIKEKVNKLSEEEEKLSYSINDNISKYNNLVQIIHTSRNTIILASLENLSKESCTELNKIRENFNGEFIKFKGKSNLSYKEEVANNISLEANKTLDLKNGIDESTCSLTSALNEEILINISAISINYPIPPFSIEEPYPICCFYGECQKCCDETCSNEYYPIIFLHGHSFNKETSADYSLDTFGKIKKKLSEEKYIDAGAVVISQSIEQKGIWGKVNAPIQATGSYFFDVSIDKMGGEMIMPSKTDGIDTYAIRLNDLIETVKYKTGKEKVIIIAHSMGGLVTRRYIQVFGEEDVDRIILITVPNRGIEGTIKNYCSLIGSKMECSDMSQGSILINKLENVQNITVPLYNIIGTGCEMGLEKGDGIVTETSQHLNYANNYYIEGTCNELSFEFLHEKVLNPEKYPGIYELIKEFLK